MVPSSFNNFDSFLVDSISFSQDYFTSPSSPGKKDLIIPETEYEYPNDNQIEETINENNPPIKKRKTSSNSEIVEKIENLELMLSQKIKNDDNEVAKKIDNIKEILKQITKPIYSNKKKLKDIEKKIDDLKEDNESQKLKEMLETAQKNIERLKEKNFKLKEKIKEIKVQSKKEKDELEQKNKNLTIQLEDLKIQSQKSFQELFQRSQYYESQFLRLSQAWHSSLNIQYQEQQPHFQPMPSQIIPLQQQIFENPPS